MPTPPRVVLAVPTYEPEYLHDPDLEATYVGNFDSFREPKGDVDFTLVISDFGSSRPFKAFLRSYIGSRPAVRLVDGDGPASVSDAFNVVLGEFAYDYAVYVASDVRARDRAWLLPLLADFNDPAVQVAVPTVTFDGLTVYGQTQSGPRDRPSRRLRFPEGFNLHCAVFSSGFLETFDNRYPDIFDTDHTEYCVMYQLAAVGGVAALNYRVNMIHEHPPRRHHRGSASSWRVRHGLYEADRRKYEARRLFLPEASFLAARVGPLKRLRKNLQWMRQQGWRYWLYRRRTPEMFENFCALNRETRIALTRALFYRPQTRTDRRSYTIHPAESATDRFQMSVAVVRADG